MTIEKIEARFKKEVTTLDAGYLKCKEAGKKNILGKWEGSLAIRSFNQVRNTFDICFCEDPERSIILELVEILNTQRLNNKLNDFCRYRITLEKLENKDVK